MGTNSKGIIILGLGPGDSSLLTRQAWALLNSVSEVYVRTSLHPALLEFPDGVKIFNLNDLIEDEEDLACDFEKIVTKVLELGQRPEGVVYAVPGHPSIAEATSPEIIRRARDAGIPVTVVEGVSLMGHSLTALEQTGFPHLSIIDALELGGKYFPPFPPNMPILVTHVHSQKVLEKVKTTLLTLYPRDHPVQLVYETGTHECFVESLSLQQIDQTETLGWTTALYLPPLGAYTSYEEFQELIAHLRSPDGCPWDREQTHQTLRRNLMEETYEVLHAIDKESPSMMQEELGDLLLQITLHAQIAAENQEFTMSDLLQDIHTKLIRRHPHVFGDADLRDAQSVIAHWERIKAVERGENDSEIKGLLEGIPVAMPSLAVADAYQRRAARVGFDWPEIVGVIDKVKEELDEFQVADDNTSQAEEIGDILFAVANLARWVGVDPESALRETNSKFKKRFNAIEAAAQKKGVNLSDMSLDEMDEIWEQTKGKDGS